ncbi:hypothetical protein [Nocardioides hankookensis]|uniref:Uncharacterized protein n=1 Tax=Nocardioides hankookensis TaxID=443157 RepID=A0ABW1LGI1_9ACTN
MPSDAPRRVQPLSGYLMTGFVLFVMFLAGQSFFSSETILFRVVSALWFAGGALVLWYRWRPRADRADPPGR